MGRAPRRRGGSLRDGERRRLARTSRHERAGRPASGDGLRVLCDGGSRGNPGPAAIAAVLMDGATVMGQRSVRIGVATAAEAEYRALLLGLELAADHGVWALEVRSDSRLALAGVQGAGPAEPGLAALARAVRAAAERFEAVAWTWHPAADNAAPDELVRELLW